MFRTFRLPSLSVALILLSVACFEECISEQKEALPIPQDRFRSST